MLRLFWLTILLLASACNPFTTLAPVATPTVALSDELALYRPALITSAQSDLARLDRPTRYAITLNYDPAALLLTGSQSVVYFNRQTQPLNEIYFRLFANYPGAGGKITVAQVSIDGTPVTPTFETQNTAMRLALAQPLAPNGSLEIRLEYSVNVPRNNTAHYADFTASDTVITLPTVYPIIPAYDAKGWHIDLPPAYGDLVYADVALYAVTMTVPSNMLVIASGTTIETRQDGNDTTTWRMVGAPMRDFDINLTTQLQKVSAVVGETTLNSYFEPGAEPGGKKALQIAVDSFKTFQNRIGAYPYRELDIVQTPTTAGGIEYPGIVVIGRRLYDDAAMQNFFEFVIAHEVAHQWFYAVVGNDPVNYPWVDEALAQFCTYIYYEDVRGTRESSFIFRNVFQGEYNRAKNAGRDAAVNQPVSAFSEDDYGAIVYGKGPLFFDAIRKKMGDEKFFRFLKTYYERYRYRFAFPEDVLRTAEEVAGISLQNEYREWILEPAK